jgi:hypothetical protein
VSGWPAPVEDRPDALDFHTLNQVSVEARQRLSRLLAECGRSRELYRVSAAWLGTVHPSLDLTA